MSTAGFYHCSVKSVGRSNGRSIIAAAAYRSGECLFDELTGKIADYRARGGVEDSFIIARADAPDWAMQAAREARQRLWNEAERAEPRANGRLATELELALPHELTPEQRKELVSAFVLKIVEKYGIAADVAIHAPGQDGDHRNYHAHVLFTHRELGPDGFGEVSNARTVTKNVKGVEKDVTIYGIAANPTDVKALRQEWEQEVNLHYEMAGLDIRVDHRSHKDRGIEQEPTRHLGPEATAMERRGVASELGDANREIMARNEALRDRAQLEIEAVKIAAELAAARTLAEMEAAAMQYTAAKGRRDDIRPDNDAPQPDYAAAKGRTDDIRPDPSRTFGAGADRVTEPGIFDRDAADAAWMKAVEAEAIRAEHAAHAAAKGRVDDIRAERGATVQPDYAAAKGRTDNIRPEIHEERPLGKTAGDIRMALSLSRTASEFQEGLAAHGISLALTSAEEARQSQRTAAFAKEIGSFARVLREGEIVAVNGSGHVYRLDERTTGQTRNEIEGRLAGLDRTELSNIADTKEAMREAAQAAWVDQQRDARERERLPNRIESRIAECGRQARQDVIFADSEDRLAVRLKPEDEQRIRTARIYEAFAARLDEAGIAIARVKDADITAIAALREQEGFDRASGQAHRPRHFAADLVAGDMAAVTGSGEVYRINPEKIGDAKQHLPEELPGVIETRARIEIEREQKAELYGQRRADNLTAQQDYAAGRESSHQAAETARNVRQFNQDIGEAVDTGWKATGGFMRGLASAAEKFIDFLGDMLFPAPPPTPDQAERMVRSAEEKQQAHAEQAAHQERTESQYWLIEEARRRVAEQEREDGLDRYRSGRSRDDDDGGRERDRGYELER